MLILSPRPAILNARLVRQGEMVDMLASRKGEEEALCAICADGTSVEPNVIVFCERCDMAVHQLCYGIEQIPSGEAAPALTTLCSMKLQPRLQNRPHTATLQLSAVPGSLLDTLHRSGVQLT